VNELAETYNSKSDDELLVIYSEADELTADAREALKAEMNRRGLTEREASDYREEIAFENRREAKQKEHKKLTGGSNRHFGRQNILLFPNTGRERFDTTFFYTFMYLPVVPIGSYRIERIKNRWREKVIVLGKLPLNWEQVLQAWVFTGVVALVAVWALKLWLNFQYRH
jgi:hypothetical protein